MHARLSIFRFLVPLILLILGGCSTSTDKSTAEVAEAAFWDSFLSGDYDDLDRVIELLEQAYQEDPTDGHNTLLLAHAHFWGLGEISRDPDFDPALDAHYAVSARQYFAEARELLPDDDRIPGWYAGVTFGVAAALSESPDPDDQQLAQQLQEEAAGIMEDGLTVFPEFYNALYGIILESAPAGSPPFQQAVEYYWRGYEACNDGPVDRNNPDLSGLIDQSTSVGPKRICTSNEIYAPHTFEGLALRFGDVLVKAGEIDAAQAIYQSAMLSPTFEAWQFKSHIDDRLTADLDARSALYQDNDESNDPPLGPEPLGCMSCHAQ